MADSFGSKGGRKVAFCHLFAAFFLSRIFQEKAILHRRISDFFIHEKLAFTPLVRTYFKSGILMIFKPDFEVADLW